MQLGDGRLQLFQIVPSSFSKRLHICLMGRVRKKEEPTNRREHLRRTGLKILNEDEVGCPACARRKLKESSVRLPHLLDRTRPVPGPPGPSSKRPTLQRGLRPP